MIINGIGHTLDTKNNSSGVTATYKPATLVGPLSQKAKSNE